MAAAQTSGFSFAVPIWLMLFVAAGFLLFWLKISGESEEQGQGGRLRLFLLVAIILCTLAGIAAFVRWAQGISQ